MEPNLARGGKRMTQRSGWPAHREETKTHEGGGQKGKKKEDSMVGIVRTDNDQEHGPRCSVEAHVNLTILDADPVHHVNSPLGVPL